MMLTASNILDLVDAGAHVSPARRAMLVVAATGLGQAELAAMPIGHRNGIILEARRAALGEQMPCRAACPVCGEALEFALGVSDVLAETPANAASTFHITLGELVVSARLSTCGDLLAVEHSGNQAAMQATLLARCVEAQIHGDTVAAELLPEAAIAAIASEIRVRDPLVETVIGMHCPGCQHKWQASFEIAAFVWHEFSALADRIAGEVDLLARTYGWGEQAILALSAQRRQRYLDMVAQ